MPKKNKSVSKHKISKKTNVNNIPNNVQLKLENDIKVFNDSYWETLDLSMKVEDKEKFINSTKNSINTYNTMSNNLLTEFNKLKNNTIKTEFNEVLSKSNNSFEKVTEFLLNLNDELSEEEQEQYKLVIDQFHNDYQKMIDVLMKVAPNAQARVQEQVKQATKEAEEKYQAMVEQLIQVAGNMWDLIKKKIKEDPGFMDWSDTKKIDHFRDTLKFKDFMNEFPVMTRYMICMGQYSSKAFRRYLDKVRRTNTNEVLKKGEKEDNWIRRQADYVQYLWEAYQKRHYNTAERNMVWQEAYNNLRGEMDDFRDKYKAVEESTKEEKEVLKASNAKDLLQRLASGEQKLPEEDVKKLLYDLQNKLYKRKFSNALEELMNKTKQIQANHRGIGTGPEEEDEKSKPIIRMTEHVDENRLDEIPEELVDTQPMFDENGMPIMKKLNVNSLLS